MIRVIVSVGTWAMLVLQASTCSATDFQEIKRAWTERQKQAEFVTLKWSESRVNRPFNLVNRKRSEIDVLQVVPEVAMYISGQKVRFDDVMAVQSSEEKGEATISAYSIVRARNLLFHNGEPTGVEFAVKRPHFSDTMTSWPALLLYRGMDPLLTACPLSDFEGSSAKMSIDSNGDITLRAPSTRYKVNNVAWTLTVRPSLDYAPIRLIGSEGDRTFADISLDLYRSDSGAIVPRSWSTSMVPPSGVLVHAQKSKITLCEIGNEVDQELFDLPFPDGTLVIDETKKNKRIYLVTHGAERDVLPAELGRGATREELARTKTGMAGLATLDRGLGWFFWVNVSVAVVAGAALAYKRYSRGQRAS